MAKTALLVLALAAVAVAKPLDSAIVSENHHVSMVTPHMGAYGLGYGLMGGHQGVHSVATHSVSHAIPTFGFGVKSLGMTGMYPGGVGLGYGLMG